jgi:hypothetical protein
MTLLATGSAEAATPTSHHVSGSEIQVSCLTATRCVAVGTSGLHGNVDTLTSGAQTHSTVVRSSEVLESVSCPTRSGCWAVGPQTGGANLLLVRINSSGRVAKAIKVKAPTGDVLGALSCVSMTSCELAGVSFFTSPQGIAVGSWNGRRLTSVHTVRGPRGASSTSIESISCWRSHCAVVGFAHLSGLKFDGVVVTTSGGKPGRLHTAASDLFYGVSCVSATRCYADGFGSGSTAGLVVTLNRGAASHRHVLATADLFSIECAGSTCVAAGKVLDNSAPAFYDGVLQPVSAGALSGSLTTVSVSGGYTGIARRGPGFAAIGASQGSGSEVTTG